MNNFQLNCLNPEVLLKMEHTPPSPTLLHGELGAMQSALKRNCRDHAVQQQQGKGRHPLVWRLWNGCAFLLTLLMSHHVMSSPGKNGKLCSSSPYCDVSIASCNWCMLLRNQRRAGVIPGTQKATPEANCIKYTWTKWQIWLIYSEIITWCTRFFWRLF